MKPLFENWQKYLAEAKYESHSDISLFVADCILRYDSDLRSQADILTEARVIEGIAIITVVEPARRLGNQEVMRVKIKYTPIGMGVSEYTNLIKKKIDNIHGVLSIQIVRATRS